MIRKNLQKYANDYWRNQKRYWKTVREISLSNKKDWKSYLVDSSFEMFDFDAIVEDIFLDKNAVCCSADALHIGPDILLKDANNPPPLCVYLIEFKPWDKKPDKKNDRQNDKRKLINDSLCLKGVESYVILMDKFGSECQPLEKPVRLVYWIVTNPPSHTENVLILDSWAQSNQTGNPCPPNDPRTEVPAKVKRLETKIKINGKESLYLYDEVKGIGVAQFQWYLAEFQNMTQHGNGKRRKKAAKSASTGATSVSQKT